jgi:hypothetical protein
MLIVLRTKTISNMKKILCETLGKVAHFLKGLNPVAYYTLWRWEKEMRKIHEDALLEEKKYWEEEKQNILFDGFVDEVVAFWIKSITTESMPAGVWEEKVAAFKEIAVLTIIESVIEHGISILSVTDGNPNKELRHILEEANIDLAYLPDNITSVTTKSGSDTHPDISI